MIKRGLELILDVVEAARVRVASRLGSQHTPPGCSSNDINELLRQALIEAKRLIDGRVRLSNLSNAKGSRRIQLSTYVPGWDVEIRESNEVTSDESSTIFIGGPAVCGQLDASQLFDLARAILSWFGYEPKPAPDHPDYEESRTAKLIVEWLRAMTKVYRDKADEAGERRSAFDYEARADDCEELARRIETGDWKVKPS